MRYPVRYLILSPVSSIVVSSLGSSSLADLVVKCIMRASVSFLEGCCGSCLVDRLRLMLMTRGGVQLNLLSIRKTAKLLERRGNRLKKRFIVEPIFIVGRTGRLV